MSGPYDREGNFTIVGDVSARISARRGRHALRTMKALIGRRGRRSLRGRGDFNLRKIVGRPLAAATTDAEVLRHSRGTATS